MNSRPAENNLLFEDSSFALRYFQKHRKMAYKLGLQYSRKLRNAGFQNGKILDAGCGFGGTLLTIAKNFTNSEFFGVDLSEPLLKIAHEETSSQRLQSRITFLKEDVQSLPFDNSTIDIVLNIYMVHLVEDPVKMLNEIARVLKSNGKFFIKDLRRTPLQLVEKEIKYSLSKTEALSLITKSNLPPGKFSQGLLSWNYDSRDNF